jgi:hypothetical protein
MSGAIHLLPPYLYAFMAWTGKTVYIYTHTQWDEMYQFRVPTFHVGNKEAMGQVFLPVIGFSPVGILITNSSTHH